MNLKELSHSKNFSRALLFLGGLVLALLVFRAGVFVGEREARFGMRWRERFPDGHGAAGKILKVDLPSFFVEGRNNVEEEILVGTSTAIREGGDEASTTELKENEDVIVIGAPNAQGQIEGRFIRIFPADAR